MRMRWLAKFLYPRMMRLAEGRRPDFEVVRDGDKEVYLRRWWVIPRNNYFNVYLHHMLRDDDPILHDHMYVSVSLMVGRGLLMENYCLRPKSGELPVHRSRWVHEGDVVFRSSRMAHQLIVLRETWTIFVTGPRIKEWGFYCPKGFRHWKQYVALSQDPSGRNAGQSGRGQGCGEMS